MALLAALALLMGLDGCKQMIFFSFPPHTSHKLQPLDRGVFAPLKKLQADEMEAWMKRNPGKVMTIHDIAGIVGTILPRAATPNNIMSGFRVSGIVPFDRNIFTEFDFSPSNVSNRPEPAPLQLAPIVGMRENAPKDDQHDILEDLFENHSLEDIVVNPALANNEEIEALPAGSEVITVVAFEPELVAPLPVAPPRKQTAARGRPRRKCAVLTETPVRDAIAAEKKKMTKKPVGKGAPLKNQNGKKKTNCASKSTRIPRGKENDCFCIGCQENYNSNVNGEVWIMCNSCKKWAHEKCMEEAGVDTENLICPNCE